MPEIPETTVLCAFDANNVPIRYIRKSAVDAVVEVIGCNSTAPHCTVYVHGIAFDVGMSVESVAELVFGDVVESVKKHAQSARAASV